mmetsp:Transcript_30771/g.70997  ORF Transcript_30771/g.70997 Transcript_30771/m.70997 type:complete len:256 (-) Transcript_30771:2293-3060(-)
MSSPRRSVVAGDCGTFGDSARATRSATGTTSGTASKDRSTMRMTVSCLRRPKSCRGSVAGLAGVAMMPAPRRRRRCSDEGTPVAVQTASLKSARLISRWHITVWIELLSSRFTIIRISSGFGLAGTCTASSPLASSVSSVGMLSTVPNRSSLSSTISAAGSGYGGLCFMPPEGLLPLSLLFSSPCLPSSAPCSNCAASSVALEACSFALVACRSVALVACSVALVACRSVAPLGAFSSVGGASRTNAGTLRSPET